MRCRQPRCTVPQSPRKSRGRFSPSRSHQSLNMRRGVSASHNRLQPSETGSHLGARAGAMVSHRESAVPLKPQTDIKVVIASTTTSVRSSVDADTHKWLSTKTNCTASENMVAPSKCKKCTGVTEALSEVSRNRLGREGPSPFVLPLRPDGQRGRDPLTRERQKMLKELLTDSNVAIADEVRVLQCKVQAPLERIVDIVTRASGGRSSLQCSPGCYH